MKAPAQMLASAAIALVLGAACALLKTAEPVIKDATQIACILRNVDLGKSNAFIQALCGGGQAIDTIIEGARLARVERLAAERVTDAGAGAQGD